MINAFSQKVFGVKNAQKSDFFESFWYQKPFDKKHWSFSARKLKFLSEDSIHSIFLLVKKNRLSITFKKLWKILDAMLQKLHKKAD